MAPYAAAALKDGTDGIVVTQADQDAVNFVQAVRQANPKVKIALNATSLSEVNKALGRDADGLIENGATTIALKNAAEKQYEKDMKAAGYANLTALQPRVLRVRPTGSEDRQELAERHRSRRLQRPPARHEARDRLHATAAVHERRRRRASEGVQPVSVRVPNQAMASKCRSRASSRTPSRASRARHRGNSGLVRRSLAAWRSSASRFSGLGQVPSTA